MSAYDMTDEEVQKVMRFGVCEFCGGPRDTKVTRSEQETSMTLVCLRCGREAA